MPLQEGWDKCPICGEKLYIYRIDGNEYAHRCFSCGYIDKVEYAADDTSATDRINITADGIEVEHYRTTFEELRKAKEDLLVAIAEELHILQLLRWLTKLLTNKEAEDGHDE